MSLFKDRICLNQKHTCISTTKVTEKHTHNLEIEKSRWHGKLVNDKMQVSPVDDTLFIYCSQTAVESEMHVLMSCDSYMDTNFRINLFACANDVIDNFNSLNNENQFTMMQQSENPSLMQILAKYIYHLFRARLEQGTPNARHDTINVVTPCPSISLLLDLTMYLYDMKGY